MRRKKKNTMNPIGLLIIRRLSKTGNNHCWKYKWTQQNSLLLMKERHQDEIAGIDAKQYAKLNEGA